MTRKHFEALANALASTRPTPEAGGERYNQWNNDVQAIANVCQGSNPNFDRGRFGAACKERF